MFYAADHVNGKILWANLHLLFWLSMVPFVTGWMGENNFASIPTAIYGVVLLLAAIAYTILQQQIIAHHGQQSTLASAVGSDFKGKLSMMSYAIAIPMAFVNRWVAYALYVIVALMWLAPDRRIESRIEAAHNDR
jgi:uncharacterized membrane protein